MSTIDIANTRDERIQTGVNKLMALILADHRMQEAKREFEAIAADVESSAEIIRAAAMRLCSRLPGATREDATRAILNDLRRIFPDDVA